MQTGREKKDIPLDASIDESRGAGRGNQSLSASHVSVSLCLSLYFPEDMGLPSLSLCPVVHQEEEDRRVSIGKTFLSLVFMTCADDRSSLSLLSRLPLHICYICIRL